MKEQRGFTLIEVLLAMALVAVGLMTIAVMSMTAYRGVGRSAETTTGVILSQQQLEWLRTQGFASTSLTAGTTTTALAGAYAGYTRVTTIAVDTPVQGVKQITIQVSTPSGRSVQVVSLIAG